MAARPSESSLRRPAGRRTQGKGNLCPADARGAATRSCMGRPRSGRAAPPVREGPSTKWNGESCCRGCARATSPARAPEPRLALRAGGGPTTCDATSGDGVAARPLDHSESRLAGRASQTGESRAALRAMQRRLRPLGSRRGRLSSPQWWSTWRARVNGPARRHLTASRSRGRGCQEVRRSEGQAVLGTQTLASQGPSGEHRVSAQMRPVSQSVSITHGSSGTHTPPSMQ